MIKINTTAKLIAAFILFIIMMLLCRLVYTGTTAYAFLLWNLFLAWVPFKLSYELGRRNISRVGSYLLLAAWLLFFPNALYIITDLVHLQQSKPAAPIWFDAVLIFTSSVTGLMMAFASLFKVESFLKKKYRNSVVERLIIAFLFLGSFGVYLGRFKRWNSWDVFADPMNLLNQVIGSISLPLHHFRACGVTVLLTCLFSLLYFTFKKFPGLLSSAG